ncbi:alpha/beta hydrolase [Bosea sp. Root670]|uniref:alpha/beta fold hydrolase n=1 Tax=Bosea sp. Root670 TaxID=1736583 RepID=UPI000713FA00|nr:alpha/beta hydrolase [Bosea sp. Root670]KRE06957.1 alpha/beta hydrolase [Bosea sp. Root670]
MFEGFKLGAARVTGGSIRFRLGGSGPPLLLLHGHPRTHTTWHKVAEHLGERFTLVCPDLPGFGSSFKPADQPDHANSSKRAKALALVELMNGLGYETFSVAGHDRGSYVAFRMAMDHPGRVSKLAVLDGVPILEALERCREEFARRWWHWFFYAQPEKPERAIGADPLAWYGGCAETMAQENFTDFARAVSDPSTIHTMLEDYRAGLTVDVEHDREDLADGRKLQCPLLVLWSERDDLPDLYDDVVGVWKRWADDIRGASIPSGHHMAEEAPEALAHALDAFFRAPEQFAGRV